MSALVTMGELGVALGLIIVAVLIYRKGRSKGLLWTNYFSFGVLILALAHIFKALPFVPLSYPVDAPARYTGLILILYAMLKEVEHPKTYLLTGLGILNGLAYNEGVLLYNILGRSFLALLLLVPQYMFLVIGPLVGSIILFNIYKSSKDILALIFALGFIVYAVANAVMVTAIYFVQNLLALYYIMMGITLLIGIIIGLIV